MSFHLHYLLNHLLYFSSLNLFVSLLSNCWMLQVKVQRFPVLYSSSPNKQNLGGKQEEKKSQMTVETPVHTSTEFVLVAQ